MTTPELLYLLRSGEIDLTLTTEQRCGANGESLLEDDLVWTGAINGTAHLRDPLPLSVGDRNCEFRPTILKALREAGRDWRPVCEVSSMEALFASIEADVAVGVFLRGTIPHYLETVEHERLPPMPRFLINMYLSPGRPNEIAVELARHIRQEFATRLRRPGRPGSDSRLRRKPSPAVEMTD